MDSLERIEKRLKEIDGGKVLDVATGRGEFIYALKDSLKSYDEFIGIDTHSKIVEFANTHFKDKNTSILEMDAYKLDFEDEFFDTVSVSNSLHHFEKPEKVLAEMYRVLKKDGYMIVSEMHSDEGQTKEQKTHIMLHHFWGEIDSILGIIHNKTYRSNELEEIVGKVNINETGVFKFSYPMENPKDEKVVKRLTDIIDPYLERIKDNAAYSALKEKGEILKKRIKEIGYAPASGVFIIGKK